MNILEALLPNVIAKLPELLLCTWQTIYMIIVSGAISFICGLILGLLLVVAKKGDILENVVLWTILDKVINFFRSVPFIILLALLIPVTRFIVGTAIGTKGAMVPLIIGTIPFFSRQMQAALSETDRGMIEAAQAMGLTPLGIIVRVYLKESIPSIIRGITITFISLVGLTAMAGAIGGGGLGDFAIRYGYQRYQTDVIIITVIILVLIVTFMQTFGDYIIRKISH